MRRRRRCRPACPDLTLNEWSCRAQRAKRRASCGRSFPAPAFRANVRVQAPLVARQPVDLNMPVTIRILIADDHAIVRAGLQQFIADEPDLAVVGEASTGAEALAFIRSQACDVVLLDISMPDLNGVDALAQIRRIKPDLPGADPHRLPGGAVCSQPPARRGQRLHPQGERRGTADRCGPHGRRGRKYVSPSLGQLLLKDLEGNDKPGTRSCRSASSRSSTGSRRVRASRASPKSCS